MNRSFKVESVLCFGYDLLLKMYFIADVYLYCVLNNNFLEQNIVRYYDFSCNVYFNFEFPVVSHQKYCINIIKHIFLLPNISYVTKHNNNDNNNNNNNKFFGQNLL